MFEWIEVWKLPELKLVLLSTILEHMLGITILHKNPSHQQKIFRLRQQYILDNILVHILVHYALDSMQWPHAMHQKTTPNLNSTSTSFNLGQNSVQIQFFTDIFNLTEKSLCFSLRLN